ncbi:dienelactone hydrolase family protein [Anabaena sp. PCC 7108]|uniref:dienelactone hydrolase family protein n=1 Tax=Anabaena sp. PCC 7108 TaxID=163908 RepID=UPI00034A99CA|nr:dienelactone hydrolase family protein [Anabaena sp. PCC 7108]
MKANEKLQVEEVLIPTPNGKMPGILHTHANPQRKPAILVLMEAFGLTSHIQDVAARIAREGYVVLTPDLYYRELPNNKFSYDEVETAMAMMYRLDFGAGMENDMRAALGYLKSRVDVFPDHVGVTGFCLGGGLSFFTACKFSDEIAAVAPFYGMVLDEWVAAMTDITVPIYLFHGGVDPFIPLERIQQIESRFKELGKEYTLKLYPDADHGFFCHERSSYNRLAAEDSWHELKQFFRNHLQKKELN